MPRITFTSHLGDTAPAGESIFTGDSIGAVLEAVFAEHPALRHYILDDQGALRKHVIVFVGDRRLDRSKALAEPVTQASEIYVLQALSGG